MVFNEPPLNNTLRRVLWLLLVSDFKVNSNELMWCSKSPSKFERITNYRKVLFFPKRWIIIIHFNSTVKYNLLMIYRELEWKCWDKVVLDLMRSGDQTNQIPNLIPVSREHRNCSKWWKWGWTHRNTVPGVKVGGERRSCSVFYTVSKVWLI